MYEEFSIISIVFVHTRIGKTGKRAIHIIESFKKIFEENKGNTLFFFILFISRYVLLHRNI